MKSNVRTIRLMGETPRSFTPAETALITKVHGYMPAQQLLDILNERLTADLGPDEPQHTMDQLYKEIGDTGVPSGGHDWSSLRKLLAKAKADGVLSHITRQIIDDFAVVFSLNAGQVLRLQDVLLAHQEDDQS